MRKVHSAPQLLALVPNLQSGRSGSDQGDRVKGNLHAPLLPLRRPATRAMLMDVGMTMLDGVTRDVESEVVLQAETNTVTLEAAFCFAEFGAPHSYDAPDLVNGTEGDLTESERALAVCLATPFEGDPTDEGMPAETTILPTSANEEQYLSVEIERKHLRALVMNRRRGKRDACLFYLVKLIRVNLALMHVGHCIAWSKTLQFMSRKDLNP